MSINFQSIGPAAWPIDMDPNEHQRAVLAFDAFKFTSNMTDPYSNSLNDITGEYLHRYFSEHSHE